MISGRNATVAILTLLNLFNYLDRTLVNAVGPEIQKGLKLDDFELGWVNSIFMVGYFITSPLFGYLGDRYPRPKLVAGGVFIWSLATVMSGLAQSFPQMLACRILVGFGEASYATLAPTIIDDLSTPRTRNKLLAIFYVAMPVGAALGFVAGGVLAQNYGWRAAFMVGGGPGIALSLLALALADPPRKLRDAALRVSALADLRSLIKIPTYRATVWGLTAQTFALGGFAAWASPFLVRRGCLPLDKATITFGAITVVTGLSGTALGGWLGDRGERPGSASRALAICAVSSAIGAPMAAIALFMPDATGFLVCVGLTELAIFTSTSPTNAALLTSVPPWLRATAMAASIFVIHLLGDLISPPAIGRISNAFGDSIEACSGGEGLRMGMLTLPVALGFSALFWANAHRKARRAEDEAAAERRGLQSPR